jgi:hypothetical protein
LAERILAMEKSAKIGIWIIFNQVKETWSPIENPIQDAIQKMNLEYLLRY